MITLALISRASDPTELLVFCVLGFCAGIGMFFYGFRLLQRRRLILDTPFSKIRSASLGMVEISGLAVGPYTMVAPITARPCYYYRTLVWEWKQSGKNKEWVKIAGECLHVPFFIDDGTGKMLVDPRGADLDLHRDFQEEFNGFFSKGGGAPGNVDAFLARHGVMTSNRIRVEEYCIKPKNSLFILGTLAENPGLAITAEPVHDHEAIGGVSFSIGSFALAVGSNSNLTATDLTEETFEQLTSQFGSNRQEIIRLSTSSPQLKSLDMSQQQKIAAAMLRAGVSNPAAWQAAGVTPADAAPGAAGTGVQVIAAPQTARGNGSDQKASPAPPANGFDLHPPAVLMKGTNNKTFLISWRSQREVASSLGWKCALMIWGGPALALICLYFFLGIKSLF